jgi:hypothetical protein
VVKDGSSNAEDFERLENMGNDMPDNFDDFRRSSNRIDEDGDRQHDLMANAMERPESLNDFLLHQLAELDIDDDIEKIAERIISCLDARDGGYFKSSLIDMLPPDHKPEDLAKAEEALRVVQSLEPAGIAARNLRECLLSQLNDETEMVDKLRVIIGSHLDDLAENRMNAIQKKTGYSIDTIQKIRDELHKLNPKPGASFMETFVPLVTPDIIVERSEQSSNDPNHDGGYVVRLIDDYIPNLRISEYYRRRLMDPKATEEEKEFIKRKVGSAQWLIESIQQRRRTLTRVAQAIVDFYTSLAHPYFRAPHLTIATPTRFFPERGESTDILFMTARGDHPFDRTFRHAFLRPGLDPDRWGNRSNYAAWHIVPTGFTDQGPTELSLYVTPFRRFTLRLDGFASIHADADIGIATTKLFVMGGDRLEINASTSGGGRVRVELIDSSGDPIDGFRFEDCEPFVGDSIGHTVRWEKKASLASLTGIPIRARFELLEADLYAIQFATTTPSDGGPKSK